MAMAAEEDNAGNADNPADTNILADTNINVAPDAGAWADLGFLADSGAGQVQAASGNASLGGAAGTESSRVVTGGANLPPDDATSAGLFLFPSVEEAGGVVVHDFSPLDVADIPGAGDPNAGLAGVSVGGGMTIALPDETRITFVGILPAQPPEL